MQDQSDSIAQAYQDHASAIRGYIYSKTSCYHTAEDFTQETFIRLHKSEQLDQLKDVKSYLFRIANNLVIDHYRSKNGKTAPTEIRDIEDEKNMALDAPSVEDIIINREFLTQTADVIGELSGLCQRIFWLSRAQGFHNHEIAQMQNICLSTVEKNISRATKHCASRLMWQIA